MSGRSTLRHPTSLNELFMFRLSRLLASAGAPVIRLCEGQYSITRREWRLIVALAQGGTMLSSQLANRIQLDRGRTSKAVSELVQKELVIRRPRANDRRRVDISLTAAGSAIYDALFPAVVELNQDLLSVLTPAEVEQLDACLARLQAHADRALAGATLPKADRRRAGKRPGPPSGPPG
jgi:DNA-binding MarR family transcriptional regulator